MKGNFSDYWNLIACLMHFEYDDRVFKFEVKFILLHDELYPPALKKIMSTTAPPVLSLIGITRLLD